MRSMSPRKIASVLIRALVMPASPGDVLPPWFELEPMAGSFVHDMF
jgi:hypothetical protein